MIKKLKIFIFEKTHPLNPLSLKRDGEAEGGE